MLPLQGWLAECMNMKSTAVISRILHLKLKFYKGKALLKGFWLVSNILAVQAFLPIACFEKQLFSKWNKLFKPDDKETVWLVLILHNFSQAMLCVKKMMRQTKTPRIKVCVL